MSSHRLATPDLVSIFQGESVFGLSDWQLLERYQEHRDEIAFEALVTRHGPMVLGVCRRALLNATDVEDAFQATFLVLVRRAGHLSSRDAIGPWLHGVAVRVALCARGDSARSRRFSTLDPDGPAVLSESAAENREIERIVDEELNRLPSKYREPLVLCYLQEQTHEQAARQLKWPIGTVKGRLARARDLLRGRLARRGLAPTIGVLTFVISQQASAEIERTLVRRTAQSAMNLALGQRLTHVASTSIVSLVEGVLSAMFLNKLKWIGLAALFSGLTLTGAGVMARQGASHPRASDSQPQAVPIVSEHAENAHVVGGGTDLVDTSKTVTASKLSDPRQDLLKAARAAFQAVRARYVMGEGSIEQVYETSKRWIDAQKEMATTRAEEIAAITDHQNRLRDLARLESTGSRSARNEADVALASSYFAEAAVWLSQASTDKRDKPSDSGEKGPGKDPQSKRILGKLEEPLIMNFPTETPLGEVLDHIKTSTKSPAMPKGIPVYVDPIGLQESEKSLTSTVTIDLDGVPLRRTLQLMLKQIGLVYYVYDGMLYITSEESEDQDPTLEPSPLKQKMLQAERGEMPLSDLKEFKELLKIIHEIKAIHEGAREDAAGAMHKIQ